MGGEARVEADVGEDDVLDALAHVSLAPCGDLDSGCRRPARADTETSCAPEAPERVLVGPQLAEVEALGVDVVDLAELALARSGRRAGGRPGGSRADGRPSAPGSRSSARRGEPLGRSRRHGRAASRRSSACRPRAHAGQRARGSGTGVVIAIASRSGSASRSSKSAVKRACGYGGSQCSRLSSSASQHQASSQLRERGEVAGEVRPPVAEADYGDAYRHPCGKRTDAAEPAVRSASRGSASQSAIASATRSPALAAAVDLRGRRGLLSAAGSPSSAAATASGSSPTSRFQPASTVSTHSVSSRIVRQGTRRQEGLLLQSAGVGEHRSARRAAAGSCRGSRAARSA